MCFTHFFLHRYYITNTSESILSTLIVDTKKCANFSPWNKKQAPNSAVSPQWQNLHLPHLSGFRGRGTLRLLKYVACDVGRATTQIPDLFSLAPFSSTCSWKCIFNKFTTTEHHLNLSSISSHVNYTTWWNRQKKIAWRVTTSRETALQIVSHQEIGRTEPLTTGKVQIVK